MMSRSWEVKAKCVIEQIDPNLFDISGCGLTGVAANSHARLLCEGCPVMRECAKDALLLGDSGVVRAGVAIPESLGRRGGIGGLMFVVKNGRSPKMSELREFMESHDIPSHSRYGIEYRISV